MERAICFATEDGNYLDSQETKPLQNVLDITYMGKVLMETTLNLEKPYTICKFVDTRIHFQNILIKYYLLETFVKHFVKIFYTLQLIHFDRSFVENIYKMF